MAKDGKARQSMAKYGKAWQGEVKMFQKHSFLKFLILKNLI